MQQHADVTAIQPIDHQSAAEHTQKKKEDRFPPAQSKTIKQNDLNLFPNISSSPSLSFQSLSFSSSEFLTEPKLKSVEEIPSEESDALRAALDSLGFGENVKVLTEQRDHLEVELQRTKAELQAITKENDELKLQLRGEAEQPRVKSEWSSKEKVFHVFFPLVKSNLYFHYLICIFLLLCFVDDHTIHL